MRNGLLAVLVLGVSITGPARAAACDFSLAYNFFRIPTSLTLGAGINIVPGTNGGSTYLVPSMDLGIPIGGRAVARPAVGVCIGDGESLLTLGGAAAANVWTDPAGRFAVNLQTHLARASGEGWSELTMPLVATGSMSLGETATGYAGFGLQISQFGGYLEHTDSESNPVAFLGATIPVGVAELSAAAQVVSAYTTQFGVMLGLQMPLNF